MSSKFTGENTRIKTDRRGQKIFKRFRGFFILPELSNFMPPTAKPEGLSLTLVTVTHITGYARDC